MFWLRCEAVKASRHTVCPQHNAISKPHVQRLKLSGTNIKYQHVHENRTINTLFVHTLLHYLKLTLNLIYLNIFKHEHVHIVYLFYPSNNQHLISVWFATCYQYRDTCLTSMRSLSGTLADLVSCCWSQSSSRLNVFWYAFLLNTAVKKVAVWMIIPFLFWALSSAAGKWMY